MVDGEKEEVGDDLIAVEQPIVDEPVVQDVEEDDRLGDDDSDAEGDASGEDASSPSPAAIKRKRQREVRKRGRDNSFADIARLTAQNDALAQRLAAIEGHAVSNVEQTVANRLAQAERDTEQAEHWMAKAIEAGNGVDAAAAIRIRDAARDEVMAMRNAQRDLQNAKAQPAQQAVQQPDQLVAAHAREWLNAHKWYDPNGTDADSIMVKQIDVAMANEGDFDPRSKGYFIELSRRVAEALDGGGDMSVKPADRGGRKSPPVGAQREHAPVNTRNEIYVTPERKAAMEEAGVWDDPKLRQRYLKSYRAYDSQPAR